MPRTRRLKVKGEVSYYHIASRTVGQQYLLGNGEKETLLNIIKHYSGYFFIKVLSFCIMDNHFHLLVKSEPESFYDDEEVVERIRKYSKRDKERVNGDNLSPLGIQMYREKLENISEYVRSIKQTFSVWYNKNHNRTGYFWGGRFKSVLLEEGKALMSCQAYIELNPVRAGIVKLPEEYRWSSLSYRIARGNRDHFLSYDDIYFDEKIAAEREVLSIYRYLVYKAGNMKSLTLANHEEGRESPKKPAISDEIYNYEQKRRFILPKGDLLLKRIRYFSDGLVIGSKGFIKKAYNRFGGDVILKKDRNAYQTGLGNGMLSLRKLKASLRS